jgi:putative ribosome biogenesis GTPase RsgA
MINLKKTSWIQPRRFLSFLLDKLCKKYTKERLKTMTLSQKKIDVTDRVVGKLKNGEIQLFLGDSPIGKIQLTNEINYRLDHHFEVDQQKIFQNVSVPGKTDPKYTDCDDGGWC